MKNKIAEAVCIATQKTNYSCENIKHTCKKRGGCAYCLVMAEELIANGVTLADYPTEKGGAEE
jgi:radical SAM superfamily enzyme